MSPPLRPTPFYLAFSCLRAVLQLAADAPRSSHTSQAAMRFRSRPDGMLLNKEPHWSPNLMVLWDPGLGRITSIGMSPDGLRVSGVCMSDMASYLQHVL